MALVPCKECKHQVADSAKTCPNCGVDSPAVAPKAGRAVAATPAAKVPANTSRNNKIAIVLVAVVAVLFAIAEFGGPSEAEKNAAQAAATTKRMADNKAAEEKKAAEAAACKQDLQCLGDKGLISATVRCPREVERLAKNSMKWTDKTFDVKFSHFRWKNQKEGEVTFIGDKAQFQNGFGAYVNVVYECDLNAAQDKVLDVRVREGRLN